MKVILEFNKIEEAEELEMALKASDMHCALFDIAQQVFRPHRKHGYDNEILNKLNENDDVNTAISMLEDKFYEILSRYKVEL